MRLLLLLAACTAPVGQLQQSLTTLNVGVATAVDKVRPDFALPAATSANVEAARNEFEPFQIVIAGPATGVSATATAIGPLAAPRLYAVQLYDVVNASNQEGASGDWPDPLVPDVDAYAGEKRNAFPFDVPAGQVRAIWVELFVPPGTTAGMYAGSVVVHASGAADATVAVNLRVRDFDLPSTATLKSAFGFGVDEACRAHMGQQFCNSDADAKPWILRYGKAALDHRISFWNPYYTFPTNGDFTYFDGVSGTLLDGTAPTQLAKARMTTTASGSTNGMSMTAQHFTQQGWKGLFQYTCDEPPASCAFSDIPTRAAAAHAAGIRTLVTTNIDNVNTYNLGDAIDILTPVLDAMQPPGSANDVDRRADYNAFLARSTAKELWIYQSCDQHGCHAAGSCDTSQASDPQVGWASYMIDGAGVQNRAMEWLSYRFKVSGELYYETVMHLDDAWNSHVAGHHAFCDFGGNGDGALFYPGTPAQIGGTTDIPVESQRLKLIREGMEDYEYLHLLDSLGGGAQALAEVKALFPAAFKVTQATPAMLYAARSRIADAIEQAMGKITASAIIPHAPDALPVALTAGDAAAAYSVSWDETALHVVAEVTDPFLQVIGSGPDGDLWNGDGVEVMLDVNHDKMIDPGDRHVIVNEAGDLMEASAFDDRSATLDTIYHVTKTAGGYHVDLAIPWTGIGVTPSAGMVLGMDLALNNLDASTTLTPRDWAGILPFAQPLFWHAVQLAGAPSPSPSASPMPTDQPDMAQPPAMDAANPDSTPPATMAARGCDYAGGSHGGGLGMVMLLSLWLLRRRQRLG